VVFCGKKLAEKINTTYALSPLRKNR